jgi:hypothetical protein
VSDQEPYRDSRDLPRYVAAELSRRLGRPVEHMPNPLRHDFTFRVAAIAERTVPAGPVRFIARSDKPPDGAIQFKRVPAVPERWIRMRTNIVHELAEEVTQYVSAAIRVAGDRREKTVRAIVARHCERIDLRADDAANVAHGPDPEAN